MHELMDGKAAPEAEPFSRFETLLADAIKNEVNDPTAMAVATVDANGLYRAVDGERFALVNVVA